MGTYGIPFRPPRQESEDYQRLVVALDPKGRLVDLLCGPTLQDPLGTEARDGKRHPCTRPPRLRMPSSAGYVARHKYPQRLDYVFYRPTVSSLIEHEQSRVEPFEVVDQPFEYLSDHFGIRASFRFRCSFAWARAKCSQSQQLPKWRRILSTLSKHSLEVSLCIISVPVLWQTWRHERMNTISSHLWAMLELLGVPKRWAVHWRICGGLLGPSTAYWNLQETPPMHVDMWRKLTFITFIQRYFAHHWQFLWHFSYPKAKKRPKHPKIVRCAASQPAAAPLAVAAGRVPGPGAHHVGDRRARQLGLSEAIESPVREAEAFWTAEWLAEHGEKKPKKGRVLKREGGICGSAFECWNVQRNDMIMANSDHLMDITVCEKREEYRVEFGKQLQAGQDSGVQPIRQLQWFSGILSLAPLHRSAKCEFWWDLRLGGSPK